MTRPALVLLAMSVICPAAEEVVLQTGFRIVVDRHEVVGETLRLFTATGTLEFPRAAVAEIVALEPVATPAAVAVVAPVNLPPPPPAVPKSTKEHLRDAAFTLGLPPEILLSVAKIESAFQVHAVSPKGALGVMQLMPATARTLQVDPLDPQQNIEGGARLLRDLLVKYQQYPDQVYRALSAYNAGEGAVARYNGVPPYLETRQYVEKVLNEYHRLRTGSETSR